MLTITAPCESRCGTGRATHENQHTEMRQDQCQTCAGTGQVLACRRESRATSWPWAVPDAAQPRFTDKAVAREAPR